jgi:hypothetical protein
VGVEDTSTDFATTFVVALAAREIGFRPAPLGSADQNAQKSIAAPKPAPTRSAIAAQFLAPNAGAA